MAKTLLAKACHPRGLSATCTWGLEAPITDFLTIVQSIAKRAGIDIALHRETIDTFYGSGSNQPWLEVPMAITDWETRPAAGQNIEPLYTTKGIWNESHYHNATFDELMFSYDATLDAATRKKQALELAKIRYDDCPIIIAYWENYITAVSSNVYNIDTSWPNWEQIWLS